MESLARLVDESLAHHGYKPTLDHRRLQWSKWFRCDSNFSVLLAPSLPGVFALGEEVLSPGQAGNKRMLALFHLAETADLNTALGRLFLPGNLLRERVESGRCFARYCVVEDAAERAQAFAALQRWMAESAEIPQVA